MLNVISSRCTHYFPASTGGPNWLCGCYMLRMTQKFSVSSTGLVVSSSSSSEPDVAQSVAQFLARQRQVRVGHYQRSASLEEGPFLSSINAHNILAPVHLLFGPLLVHLVGACIETLPTFSGANLGEKQVSVYIRTRISLSALT